MRLSTASFATAAAALFLAPAAFAHVTLNPDKVPADSFSRFALRVPTEEAVPTVKVSVQLPAGLDEVSFQPEPGWKRTVSGRVVTWSGGEIGPGEFDEFGVSAHMPASPDKELVFPTTQTYANGKVVHWIGAESSDAPAPRVTLQAAQGQTSTTPTPSAAAKDDNEDGSDAALWLAIAALVTGVAALGLGIALWRRA